MLYVQETFFNGTENRLLDESEPYETAYDTPAEIYRFCLHRYGRCTGKVRMGVGGRAVGWTFEKLTQYEDAKGNSPISYYVREVRVILLEQPDTVTRTRHYRFIP